MSIITPEANITRQFFRRFALISTSVAAVVLSACALSSAADEPPVFDVPGIDNITIDGSPSDWADRGFRVDTMIGKDADMRAPADFDPSFRLGRNDEGLLFLATVRDDVVSEPGSADGVSGADGIELFASTEPPRRPEAHLCHFEPHLWRPEPHLCHPEAHLCHPERSRGVWPRPWTTARFLASLGMTGVALAMTFYPNRCKPPWAVVRHGR